MMRGPVAQPPSPILAEGRYLMEDSGFDRRTVKRPTRIAAYHRLSQTPVHAPIHGAGVYGGGCLGFGPQP